MTATMTATAPVLQTIPPTPSPHKPRLLYRGSLRLPDATLLPGITFISTSSPFDGTGDNGDAELSLALEMTRRNAAEGIPITLEPHMDNIEASGNVRMYVDPREEKSSAFFERVLGWGAQKRCVVLHTSPGSASVVVFAREREGRMELLVGRKGSKKKTKSGLGKEVYSQKPDDPLPRTEVVPQVKQTLKSVSGSFREFMRTTSASTTLEDGPPPQPRGNHSPGRRGEKRRREEVDFEPSQVQSQYQSQHETTNRTLLKRLITHQLLGLGLEKTDEEFRACFQVTYSGCCFALRKQLSDGVVDRQDVVRTIRAHLDLYLPK